MWNGRTIQIKLVKEEPPTYHRIESPKAPNEKVESQIQETIAYAVGAITVGYTICRSVNFFFSMAEHMIVR